MNHLPPASRFRITKSYFFLGVSRARAILMILLHTAFDSRYVGTKIDTNTIHVALFDIGNKKIMSCYSCDPMNIRKWFCGNLSIVLMSQNWMVLSSPKESILCHPKKNQIFHLRNALVTGFSAANVFQSRMLIWIFYKSLQGLKSFNFFLFLLLIYPECSRTDILPIFSMRTNW